MADEKAISKIETDTTETTGNGLNELVRIVNNHINPVSSSSGSTRTYTPPLMGTSARAAKRRIDSDSGPIRIEGTDTYNQQLQHHYQNVRQILDDQQQQQQELHSLNDDTQPDSRQSFNAKREFFEQRFKTPPPTYDSPPRQQQAQKIITTITTTTTAASTKNTHDRTSSSSNESPSVDRVLEQAVELQKMSNISPHKNDLQTPVIIERTEEYQVFLDSSNHEVRRTPSISRTSIVNLTKSGHATDLDQAQAQVEGLTDDHQAIQDLARKLHERNETTLNEYKRLPSQTNQNLSSSLSTSPSPSDVLIDRTNLPTSTNEFSVLDALVYNPIGTIDGKYHNLLNKRYNDILTNLRNPEYINSLKQSTTATTTTKKKKEAKKKSKEKKPKEKKSKKKTSSKTDTIEQTVVTSDVNTPESLLTQTTEPITTTALVEQTPLIDPKEKKKQDKENKKASKTKSKNKLKNEDYQVVDAIVSSPISLRLPDSYLVKYNVNPPLSPSSPLQAIPSSVTPNTVVTTTTTTTATTTAATTPKDTTIPVVEKNQTLYHLIKIVNELQAHHATALKTSLYTVPSTMTTTTESKEPIFVTKQSESIINEVVNQQPLLEKQQRPIISPTNQAETNLQSEPIKPRIIYRYMDEQGRILKISSVPPSELREQPAQPYAYCTTEPPYFYGRHIAIDDERRHPLPQYEQHATWQGEPKLPTTVTREDLELRDRRVPQLSEQYVPAGRTIPVSVEHGRSSKSASQQQPQRIYHYPNQQNVKLAWLPLSYPTDQVIPIGAAGYDTDSTISERSATHRNYDYVPIDSHYRYSNRPPHDDYYYNRSPGPSYYRQPPSAYYGGPAMSPEYGGLSRNYIEVFRGGDFRETKPSEVYSLPLSEQMRTSPNYPSSSRHSRYDQYQSERYGTMSNRHANVPSSQQVYCSNSLPKSRYQHNIPPSTVHASSYYTHRSPYHHRTVQSSPNPECRSYVRHSKSFDYRPLRTKLQREYKITPNLLVDEWDYTQASDNIKYSTTTSTTNRSGVSSPDDVFISNRTNQA
ncbi:unnamed protein product [Rotaria sp. Silwood2]|nr:unnamed protein product [Rotaria sp. Silwood2]CAF2771034.1 unnamed protein product [Rotaria sp. Silwood2]CAF3942109.1 unnamed protein product [Rotaria sp. Silwood2]CAF4001714.1 unnamed protein product [Rotaria sp. Silwood2]